MAEVHHQHEEHPHHIADVLHDELRAPTPIQEHNLEEVTEAIERHLNSSAKKSDKQRSPKGENIISD